MFSALALGALVVLFGELFGEPHGFLGVRETPHELVREVANAVVPFDTDLVGRHALPKAAIPMDYRRCRHRLLEALLLGRVVHRHLLRPLRGPVGTPRLP